jgi:DNA-directed RNA polymerase I, II, and III subunit RPABC5
MLPVRCFDCGKLVGHLGNKYYELLENGVSECDALTKLGLKRPCCRVSVARAKSTIKF